MNENNYAIAGILVYIFMVLILILGSSPLITTFLVAILPSLVCLIIVLGWRSKNFMNVAYMRGLPLIVGLISLALFSSPVPYVLSQIDAIPLAITNLLFSFIITDIIFFPELWGVPVQQKVKQRKTPKTLESIRKVLQTLEGNCKAINFAIGRVYTRRNGASASMRTKIKFPSEVYNVLSDAIAVNNLNAIYDATQKLYQKIELLFKSEKEVWGRVNLHNLKRAGDSSSRIVDVLANNDKDPVNDYINQIVQTCHDLIKR